MLGVGLLFVILLPATWCLSSGPEIMQCAGGKFVIDQVTVNLTCNNLSNSLFWKYTLRERPLFEYRCIMSMNDCKDKDGKWYHVTRQNYDKSTLTLRADRDMLITEGIIECGAVDDIKNAAKCEVQLSETLTRKSTTTPKPSTFTTQKPPTTQTSTRTKTTPSTAFTKQSPSTPSTYPPSPPPTTTTKWQSTSSGVTTTTEIRENSDSDNAGLPLMAMAAGAGGGLVMIIIVVVIIIVLLRRRRGSSDIDSKADDDFEEHINFLYESSDVAARPAQSSGNVNAKPNYYLLTNESVTSSPRDIRAIAKNEEETNFGSSSTAQQPKSGQGEEYANIDEKADVKFSAISPDKSTDVYAVVNKSKSRNGALTEHQGDECE